MKRQDLLNQALQVLNIYSIKLFFNCIFIIKLLEFLPLSSTFLSDNEVEELMEPDLAGSIHILNF